MVVVLEVKVTATLETGVAQAVAEAEAVAVEVGLMELDAGLLDVVGGFEPPEPTILMSAQVRYTCGVWKEFHLKERRVWLEL